MNGIQNESNALLAAIVDSCDDAIIGVDVQGKIISWNSAAERIFGYNQGEAIGQSILMLIPTERADEEPKILRRVLGGERVRHYQTVRKAKDGSFIDISLSLSPVVDSAGKIIAVSKIARDISRERKALEELRLSEERFRVTLSSIGDAVIATDASGGITFMNPVAERLTKWTAQQALGVPLDEVFKIINEFSRRTVENPVTKVIREGVIVGLANHTLLVAKDGMESPIDDSGAPIRGSNDNLTGVVLVFRDVTERRNAEEAALRLAAIVHNSDDAIISKNLDGIITTWNDGATRTFGYTADEMVGKSILTLIPPDLQKQEEEILAKLRRGERLVHFETVRLAKDGRKVPVSLTISPIKDDEDRVIGASKIARDITERKHTEQNLVEAREQLRSHALDLERQVQERTQTLEKTIGELEAFSYSLSHDMRAPLRAIQSFVEIVLADYGDKIGADGTQLLQRAIGGAQRMDLLIKDLLAFTRLSRAPITIDYVDVEKLIRGIIHDRSEFQASAAEIKLESPLFPVRGNEPSLTQCVTNLLDNAIKFVAPGMKPQIRIYSDHRDGFVRLWFEDNGIGIDPDSASKLFQMFQRMHSETYPGTGIGLAIVRKAVERMNGTAGFEPGLGQGSRFWLQLPEAS
jgi:PAS domain S-box-containing protein